MAVNSATLAELRERSMQLHADLKAAEAELRGQGYQGVPYYLKNAGHNIDQATNCIILAVSQREADEKSVGMLGGKTPTEALAGSAS